MNASDDVSSPCSEAYDADMQWFLRKYDADEQCLPKEDGAVEKRFPRIESSVEQGFPHEIAAVEPGYPPASFEVDQRLRNGNMWTSKRFPSSVTWRDRSLHVRA